MDLDRIINSLRSWACGEARRDSDVDIFIVFRSIKGFDVRAEIYNVIANRVRRALTLTDSTINYLNKELTPLGINIAYDGIIIYDRTDDIHNVEELAIIVRTLALEHERCTYGEPTRGLTPWDIYEK